MKGSDQYHSRAPRAQTSITSRILILHYIHRMRGTLMYVAYLLGLSLVSAQTTPQLPSFTPIVPEPRLPGALHGAYATPPRPYTNNAQGVMYQTQQQAAAMMGLMPPAGPSGMELIHREQAMAIQRREQLKQQLYNELRTAERTLNKAPQGKCAEQEGLVRTGLSKFPEHQPFLTAASELEAMLHGERPLRLVDAVFALEQPVLAGTFTKTGFKAALERLVAVVRRRVNETGGSLQDPEAVHDAIQALYNDSIQDPATGKAYRPLRYDLEDFWGERDPKNILVSKLLTSGEGQCRSMPLLYLMIAEELGAPAYLAFSPNHSYIKYRNANGRWVNFETTVGQRTTDAWLMASGHVNSMAVKNRIYLDTVGTRRIVAHLLAELSLHHTVAFGPDPEFTERCLRTGLAEYPQDIHAWLQLHNLRVAQARTALCSAGNPPREQWAQQPEIAKRVASVEKSDELLQRLGFAEMPAEAYAAWLRSLDEERTRRAREGLGTTISPAPLQR